MNLKTTIALIVILLAIAAAAWLLRDGLTMPPPTPDQAITQDARKPMLTDQIIDLDRLTRIELELPELAITLERSPDGWRMTSPRQAPMNPAAIRELLATFQSVRAAPREEKKTPASVLGSITLLDTTDKQVTLTLGPTLGGSLSHIVITADGEPSRHLNADHGLYHLINQLDPTALLGQRLDTPSALRIDRLEVSSAAGDVTLRRVDGRWYLGQAGTDQRALSQFVEGFTSVPGYLNIPSATDIIRYEPITAENLAMFGLDRPRVTLRYFRTGNEDRPPAELRIGSPADPERQSYYVCYAENSETPPIVGVLPWDFSTVLAKSADDFRDPRVIETEPGLVRSVAVEVGEEKVSAELAAAPPITEQVQAISEALRALAAARASAFIPAEEIATEAFAKVTLVPRLTDQHEVLRLHVDPQTKADVSPKTLLIVRNNETVAMRVPAELVRPIFAAFQVQPAPLLDNSDTP